MARNKGNSIGLAAIFSQKIRIVTGAPSIITKSNIDEDNSITSNILTPRSELFIRLSTLEYCNLTG